MKPLFESAEIFTAYATIDAGYYMMSEIQSQMDEEKKQHPLNKLIDKATGADKAILDLHKAKLSLWLIDIIEAKKVIGADYSNDEKFLQSLNIKP